MEVVENKEDFELNSLVREWCPYLNPFDNISFQILEKFAKGEIENLPCFSYATQCKNPCIPAEGKIEEGKIMIVGQNPGVVEDEKFRPFCGPSGQLLNSCLKEIGIDRKDLYITNAVKCYMETDDISVNIIRVCALAILKREILLVRPNTIVCLGRIAFSAVQYALLGKVVEEFERGKVLRLRDSQGKTIEVCATYHPSYILRANGYKPEFLKDLGSFIRKDKYEIRYEVLRSYEQVKKFIDNLLNTENEEILIAIDVETTSAEVYNPNTQLLCIGLATNWNKGYIIPIREFEYLKRKFRNFYVEGEQELVLDELKRLFSDNRVKLIGHNLKFDLLAIEKELKLDLTDRIFVDTMVLHYLLKEEPPHDLKSLANIYTPFVSYYKEIKDLFSQDKKHWYERISYEKLYEYCAYDVCVTYYLYEEFMTRIKELIERQRSIQEEVKKFIDKCKRVNQYIFHPYYLVVTIERLLNYIMKFYRILYRAEKTGVPISMKYVSELKNKLEKEIAEKEKELNTIAGKKINWNSPVQINQVFQSLGISSPITTKKGNPSYNEQALQMLSKQGIELAKILLEYRGLVKHYSSYVKIFDSYAERLTYVDDDIARINANIKVVGTETGRVIVVDPAFQTLPRDNTYRNIVCAEKGWLIMSVDYSMADLRCIAGYSGCKSMLEDFAKGVDYHTLTAAKIFKVDINDVTPEQRSIAKNINFAIAYLVSAEGLAEWIGVDKKLARKYIDEWFSDKLEVDRFIKTIIKKYEEAETGSEVVFMNIFGRMRRLKRVSKQDSSYMHNVRSAVNFYPQSTVADILMIGTLRFVKKLQDKDLLNKCRILFPVHDALLLEVKEEAVDDVSQIVKESLEFTIPFPFCNLVIPVEITVDRKWTKT